MKKDRIILINVLTLIVFSIAQSAFAVDVLLPDWNFYKNRDNSRIINDTNSVVFERVRGNQTFDKFFDKQVITVFKGKNDELPKNVGNAYLNKIAADDKKTTVWILKNSDNDFEGIFCSPKLERCEIVRYVNTSDGLVEVKYIHNNLWHFQNNIGSFIEAQNRVIVYPTNSYLRELNKSVIRL